MYYLFNNLKFIIKKRRISCLRQDPPEQRWLSRLQDVALTAQAGPRLQDVALTAQAGPRLQDVALMAQAGPRLQDVALTAQAGPRHPVSVISSVHNLRLFLLWPAAGRLQRWIFGQDTFQWLL